MSARPKDGRPTAAERRRRGAAISAAVRCERERVRGVLLMVLAASRRRGLSEYGSGWNAAIAHVRDHLETDL